MKPKVVIIHCTATAADVSARAVDAYHRSQGWSGGGYHALIRTDGTIQTGPDPLPAGADEWRKAALDMPIEKTPYLRRWSEPGAHCRPLNGESWGIAYAGGLGPDHRPADTRTNAQKWSMTLLAALLVDAINPDGDADERVMGHRDAIRRYGGSPKACPCFDAERWWQNVWPLYREPPPVPPRWDAEPQGLELPKPHELTTEVARSHLVRQGETLWRIGEIYGVRWQDIADLSGVQGTEIHPGQMLTVPRKTYVVDDE